MFIKGHLISDVYTRNPASFILQCETKHTKNSHCDNFQSGVNYVKYTNSLCKLCILRKELSKRKYVTEKLFDRRFTQGSKNRGF